MKYAFPLDAFSSQPGEQRGLTSLQFYAAMAMQGILANNFRVSVGEAVDMAFTMAEEMIKKEKEYEALQPKGRKEG